MNNFVEFGRILPGPLPEPHWCNSPLFLNQNVGFCVQSGNSQGATELCKSVTCFCNPASSWNG